MNTQELKDQLQRDFEETKNLELKEKIRTYLLILKNDYSNKQMFKMNKILKTLLFFTFFGGFIYLIASAISKDFNLYNWNILTFIIWCVIEIICFITVADVVFEKEIKDRMIS